MKIVVLDGFTLNPGDLSWSALQELGDVTVYERTSPDLIIERAQHAGLVLTNKTPLRGDTLRKLPNLKYIGVLATGYDVVDVEEAAALRIPVTNVPAYSTDSVAQLVFALLLELCHRTGMHSDASRGGEWSSSADFSFWKSELIELTGKTLGIVGMGRIGEQVARIAQAFRMNVVAYTRSGKPSPVEGVRMVSLDELVRTSDVVSLHCPLTAETEGMIDSSLLERMKPSAFLINTARGKLIKERDLADALNGGIIAGAALDVLSVEPLPANHPLLAAANCIITPHIAWATREARGRLMEVAAGNVRAFLSGKPVNVVNK
ncbi:D-2-hydroxyacid dehydrogenase [Paenibacillus thermotolerans]|uniref:D-2-hydroxyacid dehydrogenase n=1 Tax=Paenibacillus thermotolerans TaxID=3027807 RepID=UPI0023674FB8|nr:MULTISPECIES: D-2-hydroxyacid dehydrogenase [unclassified Paenibacillus]